jgi:putative MATE family efflux protein
MSREINFSSGNMVSALSQFAIPVFFALFLQSMYGAVDLLIVGQFAGNADVSAVATGSQIMQTVTNFITSLATGTTVLLGQKIGEGKSREGGLIAGVSIALFALLGVLLSLVLLIKAPLLASWLNAPVEAFDLTVSYIRICGGGTLVIIAYNLLGSIFRGIGDSRTPFYTVAIACVSNIIGDLLLVAVFPMGTAGAAIATVGAQFISVVASLHLIGKRTLPFTFHYRDIHLDRSVMGRILSLGLPIAIQDMLVGLSFLIILALVNHLGVTASAGVGVAEKVCGFIMLVSATFMQTMAAFTAQNKGAGRMDRALHGLGLAIGASLCCGMITGWITYFHGDLLAAIFSPSREIIAAAADYLRAYAFDCLLTSFLFCFVGFYNGIGLTKFVMLQGIIGSFGVRVPVSIFMSHQEPVSLFHIGLATPISTLVQIVLCLLCMYYLKKHQNLRKRESGNFHGPKDV